ncbi:hypothetical protein [Nocardiopsis sp. CNR-923]|uniref:effector-associated domain 2-containing protein n=1 Tax=Nocardiopsis sp. CNR-923 TaxID=1904965 RepID=UPI0021CCFF25|nr:hypothetical protein [Nocardiopsis sp. CNR-923]
MNARDVERLARALCDVEHVYSPRHREQLVQYLPSAVRRSADLSGEASVFARALVRRCHQHRRLGCLVRWVLYLEDRGRSALAAADAARPLLVEEEYELLVQHLDVRDPCDVGTVREDLSGVPFDQVEAVFERVRPATFRVDTPEPVTVWDASWTSPNAPRRGAGSRRWPSSAPTSPATSGRRARGCSRTGAAACARPTRRGRRQGRRPGRRLCRSARRGWSCESAGARGATATTWSTGRCSASAVAGNRSSATTTSRPTSRRT